MSSDLAISVRDVSKHYLMFAKPDDRLKQMIFPKLARLVGTKPRKYYTDFAAVDGIDLEVKRGETVGIIGRNGSGKSTLLQMICGTLQPSTGSVEVHGRIAALLELGAGFSPDFTGRENVFLNAAILGFSHEETQERFAKIAEFADIGMFMDHPVKTYSSGMYVRLAFAVAINVDPDILVIDEALAVGDEAFQRKCFARIEQIRESGASILFVSHGAQTIIQLCDRAILIDRGQKILDGIPRRVVAQYQRLINLSGADAEAVRNELREIDVSSEMATTHMSEGTDLPSAQPSAVAQQEERVAVPVDVADFALKFDVDDEEASELEVFDSGLKSQTRVDYEGQGAVISNLEIRNAQERSVNTLVMGRKYKVVFDIEFSRDAHDVEIGHHYSTKDGFHLGGRFVTKEEFPKLKHIQARSKFSMSFGFVCRFIPSTYFLSLGLRGVSNDSHRYLARTVDAMTFKVLTVDPLFCGGHFNFEMRPSLVKYETE